MFTRFQLGNHLGTACVEVDENGELISYEEYHPYGTTAWQAPELVTVSKKRYKYTGMERDEETGLQRHGVRYYVGWLGRWLSADPIGLGDGVNRYCYCHGGPVGGRDSSGLGYWDDWKAGANALLVDAKEASDEAQRRLDVAASAATNLKNNAVAQWQAGANMLASDPGRVWMDGSAPGQALQGNYAQAASTAVSTVGSSYVSATVGPVMGVVKNAAVMAAAPVLVPYYSSQALSGDEKTAEAGITGNLSVTSAAVQTGLVVLPVFKAPIAVSAVEGVGAVEAEAVGSAVPETGIASPSPVQEQVYFASERGATADPGTLRLPPTRVEGADPIKLSDQIRKYGMLANGMPAIQVTRGANGEMMINDGVTRATRIDWANQLNETSMQVPIEVIEDNPSLDLSSLPQVRERSY